MLASLSVRTAIIMIAFAGSVQAAAADDERCRVMDPTGTPLNVRTSPSGRVIGNLPNDMLVKVIDRAIDRAGKSWVYVSKALDGQPIGWVYRQFLACE